MSDDISLEVVKKTQEKLGPFVKKPPLTEKLLKKPPFRFIHDIITAVIKNTGFFEGLLSAEELNSENVKDREKKIAFLQKIIKVTNMVTESSLTVRPSKIISGQEPEKTNELLQKIGEALQQNLSSEEAVKSIISESNAPKIKPQNNSDKKTVGSKLKAEEKKNKNSPKSDSESKLKTANKEKKSNDIKKKPIGNNIKTIKSKDTKENSQKNPLKKQNRVIKENIDEQEHDIQENINKIPINDSIRENNTPVIDPEIVEKTESKEPTKKEDSSESRPTSQEIKSGEPVESISSIQNDVLGQIINDDNPNEEIIKKIEPETIHFEAVENPEEAQTVVEKRKRTASSKATRSRETIAKTKKASLEEVQENNPKIPSNPSVEEKRPKTSLRPPSVRPSSSRPGAPRFKNTNVDIITSTSENMPKAKVNIIIENYGNQPEEDDGSVIVEQTVFDDNIVDNTFSKSQTDQTNISGHGHLVQQILETKKELDGETSNVEIEWEWGSKRERETSSKEIETLRNGLQSLSRAANPLGKLMDYVQEDVEIMRQELLNWRQARQNAANALHQQENLTEKAIQPLEAKLKQLEASIVERTEMIYTVKSNIYRNGQKIQKLINKEHS